MIAASSVANAGRHSLWAACPRKNLQIGQRASRRPVRAPRSRRNRAAYAKIFVVYADFAAPCELDALLKEEGSARSGPAH